MWLSEFGSRNLVVSGGHAVVVVAPLQVPPAKSHTVVLSYAVMRAGDRSRVHTPGPESWYKLAGEQSLGDPAGAIRAKPGDTPTVVIHDSDFPRGTPSQWQPFRRM